MTLLARSDGLEKSMSRYLIDQLAGRSNIHILTDTEVVAAHGESSLEAIDVHNSATGETKRLMSGGLFIFIGADAETEWLPPEIALDLRGYVLTGPDVKAIGRWNLERDPYLLETSVPGIFACGDPLQPREAGRRRRWRRQHGDRLRAPVPQGSRGDLTSARPCSNLERGHATWKVSVGRRWIVMGSAREGGCGCGTVRYRLKSEPLFVHCCHCLNCQRQTGSAFVINLLIEADRLELLAGEPVPVTVPRDAAGKQKQEIFRCPTCQVAVFSVYTRRDVRFVRGGTLDDPSGISPDVQIFTRSKLPWVALPESVPAFDAFYDVEKLWPAASLKRLAALQKAR